MPVQSCLAAQSDMFNVTGVAQDIYASRPYCFHPSKLKHHTQTFILVMTISRLQAALATATSEVTVAAANLNFDFTLVKYEAPKEYQPLGGILSAKRKENAEHGSIHRLARQLGALFEDVCPASPGLIEAYGKRASEIAKSSASDQKSDTLFSDYTGIDGTSIWAAATSSKAALHVHLLASLLARMWSAPEAIAIWMELVAERRKSIATKLENGEPLNFSLAAAVGQEITRNQLAAWDTSARAWLCTADEKFERKQKQLELILKNIDLPVVEDSRVFSSVIKAWVTAVETMDKLVRGMPQAVHDGACLLGLSAWHFYPDIAVFSPKVVEITMSDPFVAAGGVLSIGLATTPHKSGENNGVYWSLSLAQLRFYGKPVRVERALEIGSRITFPQLDLVIFGVFLAEWQLSSTQGHLAAETISSLVNYLDRHRMGSESDRRLMKLLRDSAQAYIKRTDGDRTLNEKLIQLGRKRARNFIHGSDGLKDASRLPKLFSLLQPEFFMDAFKDVESQILFLRHAAGSLVSHRNLPDAFLVRCATGPIALRVLERRALERRARERILSRVLDTNRDGETPHTETPRRIKKAAIDSVGAHPTSLPTDTWEDEVAEMLEFDSSSDAESMDESDPESMDESDPESMDESDPEAVNGLAQGNVDATPELVPPTMASSFMYATAIPIDLGDQSTTGSVAHHRWLPEPLKGLIYSNNERTTLDADTKFQSCELDVQIVAAEDPEAYIYDFVLGDPKVAALFIRRSEAEKFYDLEITMDHLIWCLEHDLMDPSALLSRLCYLRGNDSDGLHRTVRILAVVATVYDDLPDTNIDIRALDRSIIDRRWARDMFYLANVSLERPRTFALISYFESGTHDIDPSQLQNVIVMCSTNSLFVCQPVSARYP
jgi:hypothetical protein